MNAFSDKKIKTSSTQQQVGVQGGSGGATAAVGGGAKQSVGFGSGNLTGQVIARGTGNVINITTPDEAAIAAITSVSAMSHSTAMSQLQANQDLSTLAISLANENSRNALQALQGYTKQFSSVTDSIESGVAPADEVEIASTQKAIGVSAALVAVLIVAGVVWFIYQNK